MTKNTPAGLGKGMLGLIYGGLYRWLIRGAHHVPGRQSAAESAVRSGQ